jgi:hypothetical protein
MSGIGLAHSRLRRSGPRKSPLSPLSVIAGRVPPRVLGLVTEWAALHRDELLEDWDLARQQAQMKRIAPLE